MEIATACIPTDAPDGKSRPRTVSPVANAAWTRISTAMRQCGARRRRRIGSLAGAPNADGRPKGMNALGRIVLPKRMGEGEYSSACEALDGYRSVRVLKARLERHT